MHPLKKYRLKHKTTAREIAEEVEAQGITCDISYIYHIESGRANPSYKMAKAISVASAGEINIIELLEHSNSAA